MNFNQMAQNTEIKIWNLILLIIQEEGPLMKTIHAINKSPYSKIRTIALLIIIWATIGFVSGIILGRLIYLFQLL